MGNLKNFVHLQSEKLSLIFDCRSGVPVVLYFSTALQKQKSEEMLSLLAIRQEAKCALSQEVPLSLSPCLGHGFTGSPGIDISNQSDAWSLGPKLTNTHQVSQNEVVFTSHDKHRDVQLDHHISIDSRHHVILAKTQISNLSEQVLNVNYCASPTITLPDHISKILSFEGRWSLEFQQTSIDLFLGAFVRENRKGKTSHDNFPGVILHSPNTNELQGECYGFHLGWSGNHRTRVELLPEQRTYVQMGELLSGQEITLQKGQSYTSPTLYASYSNAGLSELSYQFHSFVRDKLMSPLVNSKPRPVHYNTWEGIYFDHDTDTLKQLANTVASVGAERFVLDDGWFKGRNSDKSSLGDWIVDNQVYPEGLDPIIKHVEDLGMEFGIWFEPEMINPDSDLYRAHPDWVLSTQGNEQIMFRNQLVLDLTRAEVCDYLFTQISNVLTQYPTIKYIKWDMNRDINHAGNHAGIGAIHAQTKAVYDLIEQLKAKHSHVEIESCSSGGARIDYGILSCTDRVWTSDSNDALDRLSIQRGASFFFPIELLGSHVGPRDCHITGRRISMDMRIAVSMFGSMGMEMDPRELNDSDKLKLKQGLAFYKDHRQLIHKGRLYRFDLNGNSIDFGIVSDDKQQALFAYNSVMESRRTMPRKYRFAGLKPSASYQLTLAWPTHIEEYTPSLLAQIEGKVFSGEVLMNFGMQLPITFPQCSLVFKLQKV